ncbi:MAG: YybS family protein [Coriobacteriia bacterium]|nr:YybS family protein [Coriobacteriia bacterium]
MASAADSGDAPVARIAAALLAVAVGAVVALVFPPVGLPVAAAALAWVHVKRGPLAAIVAAVIGGAVTIAIDRVGPLYVTPWLLVAGPLTVGILKRMRFESAVLAISVAVGAVWAGAIAAAAAAQGTDVAAVLREAMRQAASQGALGAGGAFGGATEQQLEEVVAAVVRVMPAVLAFLAGATAVASVGAVVVVLRRLGVEVRKVPPLAEFDLDPRAVWPLIAGIVLIAADKFSGGWRSGMLGTVGENLLLVMRWVFFAQGIAVFAGLYERSKMSRTGRAFGYAALAITEAVLPLVSLTGLLDVWMNLRKLSRDGRTAASPPSD